MLVTLYKMGEMSFHLVAFGFHVNTGNERFTAVGS